ncbi:hypothetical protein PACTADRAFT_41528 [Pachysolen tannophilus NRRL Y-2460]|uniref:Uncharacterized protein n=1 Tax=Pachysolen tannophilus NRRL Y-2460 TaxID=669874 RepID=A0A1E4TWV3_PACTA|nr:hypothetical protein PACTADRAFT_41528 [Pachysolen tannophilus NRRL Y-2460]
MNQVDRWVSFKAIIFKYVKFIGPGILVSVAYLDPGNYSTSVSAGGNYQYHLLFTICISNLFAVLLQSLCIKLGSVTGLNLAEMCRLHMDKRLSLLIYILTEIAIVATDLAEVVGTAISLELLFNIPLKIGILVTALDVVIVLFAYRDEGTMKQVRIFEAFVSSLVALTCFCFISLLFKIHIDDKKALFLGFLPSSKVVLEQKAVYLSLGILGATVMPHSLFLGSALVQPRLKDYDVKNGYYKPLFPSLTNSQQQQQQQQNQQQLLSSENTHRDLTKKYKPSLKAINYCLAYSYTELIVSLFLIAIFVNSAILIVAGATLYGKPDADDADLFSIYDMLAAYISPVAGLVFSCAMLFSGQAAGIICTMAGQIVSEGFINWSLKPWIRRILTRLLAIIPCLIMVFTTGRKGIGQSLNASQVVLSLLLPFVSAPLIYFTCSKQYMKVEVTKHDEVISERSNLLTGGNNINGNRYNDNETRNGEEKTYVDFTNGTFMTCASILTWGLISLLNIYLIIQLARGEDINF